MNNINVLIIPNRHGYNVKYRGLHVLAIERNGKAHIYDPFNLKLVLISVKDWEVSSSTVNEILAKFTYSQYSGFKNLCG